MLIQAPQIHIFSREVTLATGELARAFFALIESEGVREIKFLGIRSVPQTQPEALLLEAPQASIWPEAPIVSVFKKISPFYTLDFLTSQLARAPSRA